MDEIIYFLMGVGLFAGVTIAIVLLGMLVYFWGSVISGIIAMFLPDDYHSRKIERAKEAERKRMVDHFQKMAEQSK